jgi:hypothetical protein
MFGGVGIWIDDCCLFLLWRWWCSILRSFLYYFTDLGIHLFVGYMGEGVLAFGFGHWPFLVSHFLMSVYVVRYLLAWIDRRRAVGSSTIWADLTSHYDYKCTLTLFLGSMYGLLSAHQILFFLGCDFGCVIERSNILGLGIEERILHQDMNSL